MSKFQQIKLKHYATIKNGYAFDSDEYVNEGTPIIRIGDVNNSVDWESAKKVPSHYLEKLPNMIVMKGDILVALTGATIGKSSMFSYEEKALLNQRVGLINSDSLNRTFLKFVIDSFVFRKEVNFLCYGGAQENIGSNDIKNISIPIPSEDMQGKIARFLSHETSKIDALIADKEKLIELLEEKRQAVITEAVTKGLDPNVKMKDSGVEWIGAIPEHWRMEKYKHLVQRLKRSTELHDEIVTAFRDGQVTLRKNRREEGYTFAIKEHGYQRIKKGDLVVHQMDAFAGAIGISDSNGKASPVYTVCIPKKEDVHLPYFSWNLKVMSIGGYIQALAKGIRERSTDFRWNDMKDLLTCVPPYNEQVEIESYIEKFTNENNELIMDLKNTIELLKEYRQSLIYEAVTGEIDVQDMGDGITKEEVTAP